MLPFFRSCTELMFDVIQIGWIFRETSAELKESLKNLRQHHLLITTSLSILFTFLVKLTLFFWAWKFSSSLVSEFLTFIPLTTFLTSHITYFNLFASLLPFFRYDVSSNSLCVVYLCVLLAFTPSEILWGWQARRKKEYF